MPGKGKRFEEGNPGGPGGARPNSGRPPNEFKEWLGNLVHSEKARERFEKIIRDDGEADTIVTSEGVEVPHRAKAQTYLQALELGWAYDVGKPNQPIELVDERPSAQDLAAALTVVRANNSKGTGLAKEK